MQHPIKPPHHGPHGVPTAPTEAQQDALDRLLNDVDAPFDPDRVWQILAELTRATKPPSPGG
jgi:hypothetical protein